jgi:hypothetical protein
MSVPAKLAELAGAWSGTNDLWLFPGDPVRESKTTMLVALAAQGKFITLQYTWEEGGAPQEGLLVIGHDPQAGTVNAVWVDSWHMQDKFMACHGIPGTNTIISLKGSYAAPPDPDWGWQIDILGLPEEQFQLIMYNITPQGEAFLAVQATYFRTA